jgi:hypothetical protein
MTILIRPVVAVVLAISLSIPFARAQTNGFSFTAFETLAPRLDWPLVQSIRDCSAMEGLSIPDVMVLNVELEENQAANGRFCTIRARQSGRIEFVVNLPLSWNGRLYIHGNGGYGGESIHGDYGLEARLDALSKGFVTAFTNLGHDRDQFEGASWAYNNREAEIDFSYRALHLTTVATKSLVKAFYGRPPEFSYFEGCSTGGGQGLKAAYRYPGDFDGIAVGAPVFDFVGLQLYGWNNQVITSAVPFSADKVAKLGELVLTHFDVEDGLIDGVLSNPNKERNYIIRDIKDLNKNFSEEEIGALEGVYRGPEVHGTTIYPGVPLGSESSGQKYQSGSLEAAESESGWATRLIPDETGYQQQRGNVETWLKYMAFEHDDPDLDIFSFDPEQDRDRLEFMAEIMDLGSADLSPFRDRGGRILVYHGWADTGVNPLMTVDYQERILDEMGPNSAQFFRTFMVPGMFHCRGGVGADRFDAITPVIAWTELGVEPDSIPAARVEDNNVVRTRNICSWPGIETYRGVGDPNSAESFECRLD